jgi:hypothetical protein
VERVCHLLLINVRPIFCPSTALKTKGGAGTVLNGMSKAMWSSPPSHTGRKKIMRSIFKAIIITSALVAGGSAFADDSSDAYFSQAITNSQLAFVAQAKTGTTGSKSEQVLSVDAAKAATTQGFAVVDTSTLSRGGNN